MKSDQAPVIVWFRRDLRLQDQAALAAAVESGAPVVPVYVLDDVAAGDRAMGAASRWWLHHSLASLDGALRAKGSRLILRRGRAQDELAAIAAELGARQVHALHHYEPWWRVEETAVAQRLDLVLHDGNYLAPPGSVKTGGGAMYKIYTPFWRALRDRMPPPSPHDEPDTVTAPVAWPGSDALTDWNLLPQKPDWAGGMRAEWSPGEDGAHERLTAFAAKAARYGESRNLPSEAGTSHLSPHLHFGELSPAAVWHAVADAGGSTDTFLGEVAWRDYAQTVIAQFPDYGETSARAAFSAMPWRTSDAAQADLAAWQQGRTGYPIVDAGMRQLWAIGWMHNRVRMITASFLIKHLLIDWRAGERWFWDCLVCADYGNNSVNWQWTAGSGIDSNMFTRIMAPLSQSDKFAAGDYIRQWVPELRGLNDAQIHDPDLARPADYPPRIVEHGAARERALSAYRTMKAITADPDI